MSLIEAEEVKFDAEQVVEELRKKGATSLQLLPEEVALELSHYAEKVDLVKQPEHVPPYGVRQRMWLSQEIPPLNPCTRMMPELNTFLRDKLSGFRLSLFQYPFELNQIFIARYNEGELGITAHCDLFRFKNLSCIVVLRGSARFYVCQDRLGQDAEEIPNKPGSLIMVRAPGFLGSTHRPIHFVRDIRAMRYVLLLNQLVESPEASL